MLAFGDNSYKKYIKFLNDIVEERGGSRSLFKTYGMEVHHILPKEYLKHIELLPEDHPLLVGASSSNEIVNNFNSPKNLILLTPSQHLEAHKILYIENKTNPYLAAGYFALSSTHSEDVDFESIPDDLLFMLRSELHAKSDTSNNSFSDIARDHASIAAQLSGGDYIITFTDDSRKHCTRKELIDVLNDELIKVNLAPTIKTNTIENLFSKSKKSIIDVANISKQSNAYSLIATNVKTIEHIKNPNRTQGISRLILPYIRTFDGMKNSFTFDHAPSRISDILADKTILVSKEQIRYCAHQNEQALLAGELPMCQTQKEPNYSFIYCAEDDTDGTDVKNKILASFAERDLLADTLKESHGHYSNELDLTKALENKDECIELVRDKYGYDGPIETGGFYIMPDGTAVKSINHADIDKFLIRTGYITGTVDDYGDGSQFMESINCVRLRRRGGRDSWILPYMILPVNQLTQAQYNVVSD